MFSIHIDDPLLGGWFINSFLLAPHTIFLITTKQPGSQDAEKHVSSFDVSHGHGCGAIRVGSLDIQMAQLAIMWPETTMIRGD